MDLSAQQGLRIPALPHSLQVGLPEVDLVTLCFDPLELAFSAAVIQLAFAAIDRTADHYNLTNKSSRIP